MNGAGNSNTRKDYSFEDGNALAGNNFYRLKLVDLDGKYTYSKTLSVDNSQAETPFRILSNPFDAYIDLQWRGSYTGPVAVRLMDMVGRVVYSGQQNAAGNATMRLYTGRSGLTRGIYVLELITPGNQYITRLLKK